MQLILKNVYNDLSLCTKSSTASEAAILKTIFS